MNKTSDSFLPLEKKLCLKITNLLRNGKVAEAISFIEEGKISGLEGIKHKFVDYLYSRAIELLPQSSHTPLILSSSTLDFKEKLCHDFSEQFKTIVERCIDHQYKQSGAIADDKVVSALLRAKTVAEQEKILPYKGKIYLPSNRYTEAETVNGIKKTAAFLSTVNSKATCMRLQTLKALIEESGFTECLIVANGPSLKQTNLAMVGNSFIIGLNSIFLHPYVSPHILICEDHLVGEDRATELNSYSKSIKVIPGYLTYCVDPDDLTIVLNHRPRVSFPVDIDFSDDIEKVTYTGGTVTYTALQVAVGLGFKNIKLVGCDASYKVENIKQDNDYATGVLESLGDDPNHFNSTYFGKGYRWHDPNPLRMMQAYSVAERYAAKKGISITNLTRGGFLEVFKREDFLDRIYDWYPKVCIVDWIDINSNAATGEVKAALFKEWPKDKLLHIYSPKPSEIKAYKSICGDIFSPDILSILPAWKAFIENNPSCIYWRPTHNRPILNLFTALLLQVERKPFALHLMDYWTVKVDDSHLRIAYEQALECSFKSASHLFVISQRMKSRLCHRFNLESQNVSVAHNYIPASSCLPINARSLRDIDKRLVFYSGNLDPDQSLDPLVDICEAIKILNGEGMLRYEFVIRTSAYHIKASGHSFSDFEFVILQTQTDDFDEYIQQTAMADLCILCYGFGSQSREYLLDSMANKMPDLIMAKSKFLAYGDPEVGTLAYLKSIGYPFIESNRDPHAISRQIEAIALMNYPEYVANCEKAFASINDEFSEMAQCHVFQRQLASVSSGNSHSADMAANYLSLANLFSEVLAFSNNDLPKGLDNELELMRFLSCHPDLIDPVYDRVRDHGITWSINSQRDVLSKSLDRIDSDSGLKVQALAWMIASQRHSRFEELWTSLFNVVVNVTI